MRRLLALLGALVLSFGVLGGGIGGVVAVPALASDDDPDEDDRDDDDDADEDDDRDDDDHRDDDDADDDDDDGDDDDNSGPSDNSGPGSANSGRDDADADDHDDDDDGDKPDDDDGTPDQGPGDAPGTPGGGPATPPPPTGGPAPSSATVTLGDKSFSPSSISVAAGGTVTWRNSSDDEHTVTADNGAFDSDVLNPGQSFQRRFPQPGTFSYRCLIHSGMTGQVTVGGGSAGGGASGGSDTGSASGGSAGGGSSGGGSAGGGSAGGGSSGGGSAGASGSPALNSAAVQQRPTGSVGDPAPAVAQAAGGSTTVEVKDFAFNPATLSIATGTEVTWTNTGEALHTVTGDSFDSGMLRSGQGFSHTFDSEGTFSYRCEFHPDMTASIQVAAAGPAPPADGAGGDGGGGGDDPPADAGDDVATTIGATDVAGSGLAATGISAAAAAAAAMVAMAVGAVLLRRRTRAGTSSGDPLDAG